MRKRLIAATGLVVAALASVLVTAAPASAATHKNGVLESGEFGLYLLQNQGGYVFDLFVEDDNFAGDVFPGTSVNVDNNTESYWNRDVMWWHVFTGAGYSGAHGCLPSGYSGNASATFKNTISSAYYSSDSC